MLDFHLSSCRKQTDGSVCPPPQGPRPHCRGSGLSVALHVAGGGDRTRTSPPISLRQAGGGNDLFQQVTLLHPIKKLGGWWFRAAEKERAEQVSQFKCKGQGVSWGIRITAGSLSTTSRRPLSPLQPAGPGGLRHSFFTHSPVS